MNRSTGGRQIPFRTRKEIIKVAGGADREITVRTTNNGPVISDRSSELRRVGGTAPVGNAAPHLEDAQRRRDRGEEAEARHERSSAPSGS